MDKQDFQEQDFMEILMRLPCLNKAHTHLFAEKTTRLRGEMFSSSRKERLVSAERRICVGLQW